MSTWNLCSCLAAPIAAFIDLRRLSGTDYHSQAQLLGYFDRFLVEQNLEQARITQDICDRYRQHIAHLNPRSQGNRFCVVRQLCQYLARTDPLIYVPEPLRAPSSRQAHRPFIFTQKQISSLLAAVETLPPSGSLCPDTFRTLLGLLYSTGIRIGEALALNIEHFFPDEQRIYVTEGKFRKSRWIVLHDSTSRALQLYMNRRMDRKPNAMDAPLLLNERCRRLCHPTIRRTFMNLLKECGIPWTRGIGPRIHDLRHTFAVHRLLAWYRDGEDINARLPALATYMGHVDISSTQVYLQPTAELIEEAGHRFHNYYRNHITSKGSPS